MSFGFEVFDAAGALKLGATTRLTRLILTRFLPAAESSSLVVPGFTLATHVAMAIPILPSLTPQTTRTGHQLTISGSTISWAPGDPFASFRANSELLVFAYQ
jgi:hypothetical protein